MEAVTAGLLRRSMTVVRFHFPYMERAVREGRRLPPDRAPRLIATWRALVERAARYWSDAPLVLAGKSLGARMASMLLAGGGAPAARAAVYLGYPLHPPGRPEKLRSAHLPDVPVPQLFVSGTRDPLCDLTLLRPVLDRIGPRARLVRVEGGDHSLARTRSDPLAGFEVWLDATASFVRKCVRMPSSDA
jgi:predicted alpha/beta-hydrolase family hydrolase